MGPCAHAETDARPGDQAPPGWQAGGTSSALPVLAQAAAAPGRQPGPGAVFESAGSEIADIDTRLQALQSFLQMAKKAGVGAAG